MIYTNKTGLPQSLVDAITKNTYDLSKVNRDVISVTTLMNPPKIAELQSRHWDKLEQDVADSIWLLLGNAVHAVMERITDKDRLIEERMYLDVETWQVVDKKHLIKGKTYVAGKPDLFDYVEKLIQDYKVTSVWSIIYGKDKEWEEQLNMYAFLFKKLGFEVKKLQIIAILKDWSKYKARMDSKYPQCPATVVDVKMWDNAKTQAFITERVKLHKASRDMTDDDIEPCSPAERWNRGDTYAVMKNTNKRAVKLHGTLESANNHMKNIIAKDAKNTYRVDTRKGADLRCADYCSVNKFCSYYKSCKKT